MAAKAIEFNSIQVLRALAAFMVVVFHCQGGELTAETREIGLGLLNSGVDIFFVISGFVMVVSTSTKRDAGQFMAARLTRIVPLYWIATALMIAVLAVRGDAPSVVDILFSLFFIPYGEVAGPMLPVLGVGWTLSYEMFFYVVFAATLWVGAVRQFLALIAVFGALVALRPVLGDLSAATFRFTSPLLFEFVAGMAVALALPVLRRFPVWAGALLVAAGFALGLGLTFSPVTLPRALYYGIPAAAIVAGAVVAERGFRAAAWRPVLAMGDASYSIYLFHGFVILALEPIRHAVGIMGWIAAVVLASAGAGYAVHLLVDQPMLVRLRKTLPFGRRAHVATTPA